LSYLFRSLDVPRRHGEKENQTSSDDSEGKKPEVDMIQVDPDERNSVDGSPFTVEGSFSAFLLAMTVGVAVVFAAIVLAVVCFVWSRRRQEANRSPGGGKSAKNFDEKIIDELGLVPIQLTSVGINGGVFQGKSGSSASSRKNSQVCYASPTPHRACALQPNSPQQSLKATTGVATAAGGVVVGGGDSLQRRAWENMLIKAQGIVERMPDPAADGDRPLSISELPPPPLFLLDTNYCPGDAQGGGGGKGDGASLTVPGEGYRSGDSVDDDIDEIDYTIRAPSFSSQLQPYT